MTRTAFQEGKNYCTRCGECCKGDPCLLEEADIDRIATYLGLERQVLVDTKLDIFVLPDGRGAVKPQRNARGCIFLTGNDCGINTVKPKGGREYECWTPQGSGDRYLWPSSGLAKIGVKVE